MSSTQIQKFHNSLGKLVKTVFFKNMLISREDGPAVTYEQTGEVEFWIEGKQYPDELSYWITIEEKK